MTAEELDIDYLVRNRLLVKGAAFCLIGQKDKTDWYMLESQEWSNQQDWLSGMYEPITATLPAGRGSSFQETQTTAHADRTSNPAG